ncbi:hypothetical protein NHG29_01410 [Aerococcaceae bacterium NML160702]|nr:hypothetical protein [Aerococcaceae bacterium NML190073]MCW6681523.1 hypothetical protein [Aerococcaceae bacterium NML160702]
MELSNDGEEIKVLFNLDGGDLWITLNRESAISMATLLLKHAQEIKKRRKPLQLLTGRMTRKK